MTEKDGTARVRLDRLTDLLIEDALALSDAELLSEASQDLDDADAAAARVRAVVAAATARGGTRSRPNTPRRPDMNESRHRTFPDEDPEYRAARDALLAEEIELRHQAEKVSALRRSLPLGGRFKSLGEGLQGRGSPPLPSAEHNVTPATVSPS